ncbi:MAG: hypothetical protein ACLFR1_15265 [Spirochaetia bacterium]
MPQVYIPTALLHDESAVPNPYYAPIIGFSEHEFLFLQELFTELRRQFIQQKYEAEENETVTLNCSVQLKVTSIEFAAFHSVTEGFHQISKRSLALQNAVLAAERKAEEKRQGGSSCHTE